ncbi:MAG: hypothetical protein PHO08_08035 [Methylococcales bacterium]|nr:hypothetical protein [Methylococcales bacterium]MDD5631011.1 hypothetical protein [Methylococcales bacterium]
MKIYFEKKLPVLLFALVSASTLVSSLPQAELAWTGVKGVYGKQDFGLRILREAMLIALASPYGAQEKSGLAGRISGGWRPVWKTPESSLSACCEIHGRDRRQDTRIR